LKESSSDMPVECDLLCCQIRSLKPADTVRHSSCCRFCCTKSGPAPAPEIVGSCYDLTLCYPLSSKNSAPLTDSQLRSQCERYESDGRIGPQLQDQCDQLASALEQISGATNSSKLFQCQMMYGLRDTSWKHKGEILEFAGNTRQRKETFVERRARYEAFAVNLIKIAFRT